MWIELDWSLVISWVFVPFAIGHEGNYDILLYVQCLAQFLPVGHSTLLVRCSELDQQDPEGKKYGALVRQITAEGHLECSVKEK